MLNTQKDMRKYAFCLLLLSFWLVYDGHLFKYIAGTGFNILENIENNFAFIIFMLLARTQRKICKLNFFYKFMAAILDFGALNIDRFLEHRIFPTPYPYKLMKKVWHFCHSCNYFMFFFFMLIHFTSCRWRV